MSKRRRASHSASASTSHTSSQSPFPETQFQPGSLDDDSQTGLWEAIEILEERGAPRTGEYLVRWAGDDPSTGKAWKPTWEPKTGCTNALIVEWKAKKANMGRAGRAVKLEKVDVADKAEKNDGGSRKGTKRRRSEDSDDDVVVEETPEKRPKKGKTRSSNASLFGKPNHVPKPSSNRSASGSVVSASPAPSSDRRARDHATQRVQVSVDLTSPRASGSSSKHAGRQRQAAHEDIGNADDGFADADNAAPEETLAPTDRTVHFQYGTTPSPSAAPSSALPARESSDLPPVDVDEAQPGPSQAPGKRLGPVPQPDPKLFHRFLPADATQPPADSLGSQVDPISQFSSPRQSTQGKSPRKTAATGDDAAGSLSQLPSAGKVVMMDGREVHMADLDSDSDNTSEVAAPEATKLDRGNMADAVDLPDVVASQAVADGAQLDSDEDDTDAALEAAMDATESQAGSSPIKQHACQWYGCDHVSKTADELAAHVRSHTDDIAPAPAPSATEQTVDIEESLAVESTDTAKPLVRETIPSVKPNAVPDAFESDSAEAADDDATIARQEAQVAELSAKFEEQIADLNRKLRNSLADYEYIRGLYADASDKAVAAVQESDALRSANETLRSQLTLGLKQRDRHNGAVVKQTRDKIAQLEGQQRILLDQARRTDDKVRRRATDWFVLQKRVEELEGRLDKKKDQLREERERNTTLQERNTELNERIAHIRAIGMGAFDSDDERMSGDESGTEDEIMRRREWKRMDTRAQTGEGEAPVASAPVHSGETAAVEVWEERGPIRAYACKWDAGNPGQCTRVFSGVAEFVAHAKLHVEREILPDAKEIE
ncbi:hypothetical protein Q5752_003327 [Cryptotrichosporon argae]